MNPGNGTCVFCGEFGRVTREHFIPKSFFPRDQHGNLIGEHPPTAPACVDCQKLFAENDQQLLTVFLDSIPPGLEPPGFDELLERRRRGIRRNKKEAYQVASLIRSAPDDVRAATGRAQVFEVSEERIIWFMRKIIQGCCYTWFGALLLDGQIGVNKLPESERGKSLSGATKGVTFGEKVCRVETNYGADSIESTWLIEMYGVHTHVAFVKTA